MSEDRKSKQDMETEKMSKAQPSHTPAAPQTAQPIHTHEAPQMQYMPQTPQMQQMPQTIYTPQMGPMYNFNDCMPQMPMICCPYLMNVHCPMMQGEMYGHGNGYTGFMQSNPFGSMQQPQFMYGSGMYAPYTGGNNMNCMPY
ncbi:MAG TPA: hypothetical protein GXX36_09245 [Clostridiaceae bacterium]|nr:hypothetical protein [Clostridiaceae bacterium]